MENNKYYKIKKVTKFNGDVLYTLFGYKTIMDVIFENPTEYSRENKSLPEAEQHLKALIQEHQVVEVKTKFYASVKTIIKKFWTKTV